MGPPDGFNAPSKQATTSHSPTFSSTFEISGHNDLTPRPVTPANNQHDPFKNAGLKRPDASTTASCSSPSEPSGRHAFPPARPQKPVTPMSMLRPTLAREEQKVDHSHRQKVALRPPPSPVGREPGPPLKSLGSLPPVPPVPSALPQRTLRSINTTRVALSTEIAQSMFPQDSTPTIASSETNRGILRSPEKAKGKGKGRYVRCVSFFLSFRLRRFT